MPPASAFADRWRAIWLRPMSDREPQTIEHIPGERRIGNGIFWLGWIIVALIWAAALYEGGIQWDDVLLGSFTGLMFACWAIEITGNKVPSSWTRRSSTR